MVYQKIKQEHQEQKEKGNDVSLEIMLKIYHNAPIFNDENYHLAQDYLYFHDIPTQIQDEINKYQAYQRKIETFGSKS